MRCWLRSGRWVGGSYEVAGLIDSFASVDDAVIDIYINQAIEYGQNTGAPLLRDGELARTGGGLLLRWDEVESLEFIPEPTDESETGASDEQERKRRWWWARKGATAQSA